MSLGSLATGAAATVTAVVLGIGSCAPQTTTPPPPAGSTPATASPTEAPTEGPTAGPTSDPTAGPTSNPPTGSSSANLAVYFVGVQRGDPVLYREFRRLPVGDGSAAARTRAALTLMLDGPALDPDYRTLWPASASVRNVTVAADAVVVDLGGAKTNSVGAAAAEAAVQQLIWTATAVSGRQAVRLLFDGAAMSDLWGHVSVSGTLRRASAVGTLAQVWLISPQHGDRVGRTFEVHIAGMVFEATAQLRVRNAAGAIVQNHTLTLSNGAPSLGEGRLSITLSPGAYTLEAFYFSAEDGSVQALDNHSITVT